MTDLQATASSMINKFGVSLTYKNPVGTELDDHGTQNYTWTSATTTKAILDRPQEESLNWERQGGIRTAQTIFYVPYDETITTSTRLTHDSIDWQVDEVMKWQFLNKYTCIRVSAHRITD